jgi:hypothetical protein
VRIFSEINSFITISSVVSHIMQDCKKDHFPKHVESMATHVQEGEDDEGLNEIFTFELDEDAGKNSDVFPMTFTQSMCQLEGILSHSNFDDKVGYSFHDM